MLMLLIFTIGLVMLCIAVKKEPEFWAGCGVLIMCLAVVAEIIIIAFMLNYSTEKISQIHALKATLIELETPMIATTELPSGGGINVQIDVPNQEISKAVLDGKLRFYLEEIWAVNSSILYWEKYPQTAFWIWFAPNPAKIFEENDVHYIQLIDRKSK